MSKPVTEIEEKVLDFIDYSIDVLGFPPTRAEIARNFGWRSPNAANDALLSLERKGRVRLIPAIARGVILT